MNFPRLQLGNNKGRTVYQQRQIKSISFLIFMAFVLVVTSIVSLRAGSYSITMSDLIEGIFGISKDNKINIVIQNNRLPRICTAILAGSGLGLAGCILQVILRNPLASASTLGVSQGASFGAAVAIVIFKMDNTLGLGVSLSAFIGSIAVALIILGLSRYRNISPEGIVLSGVAISAMFTGAITLIQYFANEVELVKLMHWTFGNLGSTGWREIRSIALIVGILIIYCYFHRWDYNALLSDRETAISLGINVRNLTLVNMLLCCLTTSVIVASVGLISFIGLVAPHIVRLVVGNNHVYLIPGSILTGATVLLLSDLFARMAISPVILPIGAITSFLGGPLFLYLLFKDGNKE